MQTIRETVPQSRGDTLIFYFDPLCPWAWRASEWIREVQRETGLAVDWRIFSLAEANGLGDESYLPVRAMALIGDRYGDEAVARAYKAAGTAIHEEGRNVRAPGRLREALEDGLAAAGFDSEIVSEADNDPRTLDAVRASHDEAVRVYGAYGVPWLVIDGCDFGFNGPVIDEVPRGDEAVEMWRALRPLLSQPHFYELKRERRARVGAAAR